MCRVNKKSPHKEKLYTLPEKERICKRCSSPLVSMGKENWKNTSKFFIWVYTSGLKKTIGRENWQFSASPKEADISATIYNIIETRKVNSPEPYTYLT